MNNNSGWKSVIYLIGGAFGIITGLAAAHLYTRSAEANLPPGQTVMERTIKPMDALKLGIAIVALVRQISDLGARRVK